MVCTLVQLYGHVACNALLEYVCVGVLAWYARYGAPLLVRARTRQVYRAMTHVGRVLGLPFPHQKYHNTWANRCSSTRVQ
jgi:hypothetical protein